MKNAPTFTGSLSTKGFCPDSNLTWDEFRAQLNPLLKEGDNSIEAKINTMVGSPEDYEDEKILATDDPQTRVDELVQRVEKTFSRLNYFYIALGRSSLKYQASYSGNINGENGEKLKSPIRRETRKIVSFALERSNVDDRGGAFEIVPRDKNGNTFTTHNNREVGIDFSFFGAGDQPSLDDQVSGYSVESSGNCSQGELKSTFSFLAQALSKLHKLRNALEKTQKRIDSIKRVSEAIKQHKGSIQEALSGVEAIEF